MKRDDIDDMFDRIFHRISRPFFDVDEIFDAIKNSDDPDKNNGFYYGYSFTVGPDGKPQFREFGNISPFGSKSPNSASSSGIDNSVPAGTAKREPFVEVVPDKKNNSVKIVAEIPGVKKEDIDVVVEEEKVNLETKGDRRYHSTIPLRQKVDPDTAKASFTNGILEVKLQLQKTKDSGKRLSIE